MWRLCLSRESRCPNSSEAREHLSLIVMGATLVYLVWRGIRPTGMRLRDLIGGRWQSPRDVLRDIALGFLLWLVLVAIAIVWKQTSGSGGLTEPIVAMLPRS